MDVEGIQRITIEEEGKKKKGLDGFSQNKKTTTSTKNKTTNHQLKLDSKE